MARAAQNASKVRCNEDKSNLSCWVAFTFRDALSTVLRSQNFLQALLKAGGDRKIGIVGAYEAVHDIEISMRGC